MDVRSKKRSRKDESDKLSQSGRKGCDSDGFRKFN